MRHTMANYFTATNFYYRGPKRVSDYKVVNDTTSINNLAAEIATVLGVPAQLLNALPLCTYSTHLCYMIATLIMSMCWFYDWQTHKIL